MGDLLGDWIERLTVGEIELLILAASLHDLGMVYTKEEKELCFEDEIKYKDFLRVHCPELIGCTLIEWPEDIQQWYLRTLHPFRVSDVLQNKEWKELFERYPNDIVPRRCVLGVCQAHGEEPKELQNNGDLEYLHVSDADPLFCALLLRLADLLDFDDTRAPRVLYSYVENNEKSREEWDKHQASSGFRYPESPSIKELPYKAQCKIRFLSMQLEIFWIGWMMNWIIVPDCRGFVEQDGGRNFLFQGQCCAVKLSRTGI